MNTLANNYANDFFPNLTSRQYNIIMFTILTHGIHLFIYLYFVYVLSFRITGEELASC